MKFLLLWILLSNSEAWAFPEMIGHGYQSCKACHYDSSGGGPLNAYGRTIAEEILSTWSKKNEGETFYGYLDPRPFNFAGDFRYLFQRYEDDNLRLTQRFAMQREMSLTFDPSKNVSFVGSAGLYGPDPKEYEYRRYYGKITLGYGLGIRAGRFMPAYGVQIADHTRATRILFTQGSETLNLEVSWTHKYFEAFLTRIAGSNSGIVTSSKPVVAQRDDRNGYAGKLSLFLGKGMQIGGSYASLTDDLTVIRNYVSYHAFFGNDKVWFYGEFQTWPAREYKIYGTLGFAPARGVWLKTELNRDSESLEPEIFGTVQLFPRPHFEFLLSASKNQMLLISHYYL